MRVIIAGSRDINDFGLLEEAISKSGFDITEVVSGGAFGVDRMGENWAREHSISLKVFPADWMRYGKKAGPIRNIEMGEYADALIAIWDGRSRGTLHMINYAESRKLKVYVLKVL